ncbi:MAG: hypothetical protein LBC88_02655 [Spirochaetaceae bacterium]|jgi:hypothetical protein|nr:hypothetical protein [Spirochaetaceae bacterium]
MELAYKPDVEKCLERVYAWYEGELLDRPPVRFSRHNAEYESTGGGSGRGWATLKDRWFDAEYQIETFIRESESKRFLAETFPVYWPNLGPHVFAAGFGCPCAYGEVTAWAEPILHRLPRPEDIPAFDWNEEHIKKLAELTNLALEKAAGRFLVGYTDMHTGMDWCAALRGTQELLTDFYDDPELLSAFCGAYLDDFFRIFDYFDAVLKDRGQLSVTWMNIPSPGKLHIPSCDFGAMISGKQFEKFVMPCLERECAHMDHNIFHLDGKAVARHLDAILTLPKLNAVQWVQGVGDDEPILQWMPLIKKIQAAGKGVVVDLTVKELEPFMEQTAPRGIYLCIPTESQEEEEAVLKRLEAWRA